MTHTIKFKDVLVFKSPHRIDWNATSEKLTQTLINIYPDMKWSEMAMTYTCTYRQIVKDVKRQGVNKTYIALLLDEGKDN